MAFGTPTLGAFAYSASGGSSVSPSYPSGITSNDLLFLIVGQKPSSANGGTVTTPSGWTLQAALTAAGGYGATLAADTGNTNIRIYTKNTTVGNESGSLSVTLGTNNVSWARIGRLPVTAPATFSFASSTGSDTSAGSVSVTGGASIAWESGDLALWAMCIPTDVTTPNQFSAHAVTASGITFASASELGEADSGIGNDIGGFVSYTTVSSGSGTVAPTVTATAGGTTTNVRGPLALLRIRETPKVFASTTKSSAWSVRNTVSQTRAGAWSVLNASVQVSWVEFEAGGSPVVSTTKSGAWSVRNTVSQTRAGAWSVRNLASQTRAGAWSVRAGVSTTKAGAWSVRSYASQTRAGAWSVFNYASQARAGAWSVRALVPATKAGAWSVRALVPATKAGAWSVRAAAATTKTGAWSVRNLVVTTRAGAWSVEASGPTIVSVTRSGAWSVRNLASDTRSGAWSVRNLASGTRAGAWSVRAGVAATKAGAWSVRASVSTTKAGAWSIRNYAGATRNGAWSVFNSVSVQRDGAWTVRNLVSVQRDGAWSVGQAVIVTATRGGAWSVRSLISATRPGAWSVNDQTSDIYRLLTNRQELDPVAGMFYVYDDDAVTVRWQAAAWEDTAGTVPYSGGRVARVDRLTRV